MSELGGAGTPWDLFVLGGGTAGLVAAKTAGRFGARVLMVERDRTGGDCLWTGCVPSKALIAAADSVASARRAVRYGVHVEGVSVDFAAVMAHVRKAIATIEPVDSIESIESTGATVITGTARFVGPDSAEVVTPSGTAIHHFRQAVVATGAAPALPPIPGLADADVLTSDTVWELTELPDDLVVLGGGSIGAELGQAFSRLGSRVTLIEGAPRLLPREDPDAAAAVDAAIRADGATVITGDSVASISVDADDSRSGEVVLASGRRVAFSRLLAAFGRTPRTREIGLESAGVDLDDRGFVAVDDNLRTTNARIWAAGDLTGHPQFTHLAGVHGSLAASNAVLGLTRSVDLTAVPRVTYTQPEVAAVGASTFADGGAAPRTVDTHHGELDRAIAEADTDGFSRLALDKKGTIIGATVVGPRAGESLGELTLAVSQGLRTRDLAGVIHAYPTYNDGGWNAAIADVRGQLEKTVAKAATGGLVRARRWLLDRRESRGEG